MKINQLAQGIVLIFGVGLILASQFLLRLNAARPAQQEGIDLNGEYTGQVTLTGAFSGVYSDTNPITTTLNLGQIDLTLSLSQSGKTVSGYVALSNTLLFPQQHVIQVTPVVPPDGGTVPTAPVDLAVGPRVQGTVEGTTLYLESEPFAVSQPESQFLTDGRQLATQPVTRQFRLTSSELQSGDIITGTYRETLWGYAVQPATVEGTVILTHQVFTTTEALPPPSTP